ncbi:MAG: MCE family protein [Alphaproteobacteria bacterium]|jgi:phospholipid/cholesterol/gamma-HCH transport system substrate-binding protein|nr:MCE family protein [Alphaproteobacteria bacterium]
MEPRANYALIGAVVILASLALVGFILWFGQSQFRESFDEYDVVFEGPVTLDDGASVRYIGIKVGEVRWVRIDRADPSRVRARIRIDSETPVKTDSTAKIDFAGITGVTYVQINAGSPRADELTREPGQPVPVITAERTQLSELISSGGEILSDAGKTTRQINKLLSDENIATVERTLANIEQVSERLAQEGGLVDRADRVLVAAGEAGESFDTASRELGALARSADTRLGALAGDLEELTLSAGESLDRLDETLDAGNRSAESVTRLLDGPGTRAIEDMRIAAQDLRRLMARAEVLVREVEQNPQSVVIGDALPYEEAR